MPRYRLDIEYDGTGLKGWQRQAQEPLTVQQILEEAIERYCGETVELAVSGRTDAGVHAIRQVAHMDLVRGDTGFRVMEALNFHLRPTRVAILNAVQVSDDFHARFSTKSRAYAYHVLNRRGRPALREGYCWHISSPLDVEAMREAARLLLGHHDFSSFRAADCYAKSPFKTLDSATVEVKDELVILGFSARSFLYHQVRNMAGTLVEVGQGKRKACSMPEILNAARREAAGQTAPACGLFFLGPEY
jgi:tRNA pseudouridine38-40 synthase